MFTQSRSLVRGSVLLGLIVLSSSLLFAAVDFLEPDSKAFLTGGGTGAVVTGQIRCTSGDTFSVVAILNQNVSQGSVIGTGNSDSTATCLGVLQTFVIPVSVLFPADGTFKKGPASLTLQAQSCDPITFTCSDTFTVTTKTHLQ